MTERDMEDLIAAFPSDFFPRRQLVLKGRQGSFSGVGRFDLLFEDEFHTNLLMELKARPAKYEDASQLARYKNELDRSGERVVMWLVAPHIPNPVRDFLDDIGIEYDEVHEAEFRRVAERHGLGIKKPETDPIATPKAAPIPRLNRPREFGSSAPQVETGPTVTNPSHLRWSSRGYDLVLVNREAFDSGKFNALLQQFEDAVPSRKNARVVASLHQWAAHPRSVLPLNECQSLLRWVITSGWRNAVPPAEALWSHLFGGPAPTWQTWNSSGKRYDFDHIAWKRWYESLPH